MAFPTIQATATTNGTTAAASVSVNLPSGIQSGDLLIVVHRAAGAGAIGWPAGWNEVWEDASDASDDVTAWAWRKADGTEGSTITVTQGSVKFASLAWRISPASDPTIQPPESNTVTTGTSLTPDPSTLVPTGGAKDYLWLAVMGSEGENTYSSSPTNYSLNPIQADSGTAGAVTTNVRVAGAGRQLNASSEDPGSFTYTGTSDDWTAFTIAVHPAPVIADGEEWFPPYIQPRQDTITVYS